MSQTADLKIAVLIDADNVSSSAIENILDEVKRYGIPSIELERAAPYTCHYTHTAV